MIPFRTRCCVLRLVSMGLLLVVASSCQPPPHEADKTQSPAGGSATGRDLSRDEAAGGHTLKRHVGQTDQDLRERLERERNISAASTYTDRETAERVVGTALQLNQAKIRPWLEREGGHPNLVLDYTAPQPIGRTLRRGEDHTEPCSHAVIVLRWAGSGDYYVLTSYPECRHEC